MTTTSDYGTLFRTAYAALHGGHPDDLSEPAESGPDEPLAQFLDRSRGEAIGRLQEQLSALEPPAFLRKLHDILVRLLARAVEADAALSAQVGAYERGHFQESMAYSDRLQALVTESARLDRDLILALREAEEATPGTLAALGIEGIGPPDRAR